MDNKSDIILNGPLNYIKLYNDKTKQTLWLFMDNHKNITKQKKCVEYEAKDIDKYFYKILTESTDVLDFFLEINPTDITTKINYDRNDNYIMEIRKIFKKIYNEQQNLKSKNVRLHYIDIRDYAFYNEIIQIMIRTLDDVKYNDLTNIVNIIDDLNYIKSILEYILKSIDDVINNKINIDDKIDLINLKSTKDTKIKINDLLNKGFIQLLFKLFKKYSSKKENENIIEFFNDHYYNNCKEIINQMDKLINILIQFNKLINYENISKDRNIDKFHISSDPLIEEYIVYYGINNSLYTKLTRSIYDKLIVLNIALLKFGSVFMDCFFLRRIIDKKCITKAIVYTGGFHTVVYIWFLVKKYDFKIVDYYWIDLEKLDKNNPINDLENKIKKSSRYEEFFEIFFPKIFNQCVKIDNIMN
jgi:hypothetical protein